MSPALFLARICTLLLCVFYHGLGPDFGAINIAVLVGPNTFSGAGVGIGMAGVGVRDEGRDFAGLGAADPHAALITGIITVALLGDGLGVGDIQNIIGIDIDAAGAAELLPGGDEFAILI